jgi:hypothetical protein
MKHNPPQTQLDEPINPYLPQAQLAQPPLNQQSMYTVSQPTQHLALTQCSYTTATPSPSENYACHLGLAHVLRCG